MKIRKGIYNSNKMRKRDREREKIGNQEVNRINYKFFKLINELNFNINFKHIATEHIKHLLFLFVKRTLRNQFIFATNKLQTDKI